MITLGIARPRAPSNRLHQITDACQSPAPDCQAMDVDRRAHPVRGALASPLAFATTQTEIRIARIHAQP